MHCTSRRKGEGTSPTLACDDDEIVPAIAIHAVVMKRDEFSDDICALPALPLDFNCIFSDKLRYIDVRGARYQLRLNLQRKIEGITGRFIVNAIDPDVVQDQKMSTAMQFAG
jgi:hypothetical protein